MSGGELSALLPEGVDVRVGRDMLRLERSNLIQEEQFLAAMEALELDRLVAPLAAFFSALDDVRQGQGEDTKISLKAFARIISDIGPDAIRAIRPVLGHQLAPVAARAVAILLDTPANRDLLIENKVVADDKAPVRVDSDGAYESCAAVRAFIRSRCNLIQALDVLRRAYSLNGYADLLGKIGGLLAEAGVDQPASLPN